MRKYLILAIILLCSQQLLSQTALIYEEAREMKTYPFGDPDPLPKPGKIYPYFRFDAYSVDPVSKEWKMICLENEWIKLWVAPEIGGKVYGAMDKTNGRYFIYYNNVVKFRDIAMRGPWTSGGVEMNFGSIGHSPLTASKVDYYMRINPDSSVSCFVGATDLPGRTEWRVEIYLPADKAWFETRTKWVNHSTSATSLYHWMNASADVADDLKYYFPGTKHIDHSGNLFPWTVNQDGRDISLYHNNDFGGDRSYHVLGKYTDWFAGYYEKSDYGFGHWSLYPLKPGKKIWMWALSRQGEIWKDLLTDTTQNKQYTEIQTGLLYNQAGSGSTYSPFKHREFEAGSEIFIRERWFPISGISGVRAIGENIALNIMNTGAGQEVLLYAFEKIDDTLDIISLSADTLSVPLVIMPAANTVINVPGDIDISEIILRNEGLRIYRTDDSPENLERPLASETFEWNSIYGLYYQAIEYMRQRNNIAALKYLKKCIEEDQYFMPAYSKLAELEMLRHRYDEAEVAAKKVLAFDAYDPEANYIYALLQEKKGMLYGARDAYGIAMLSNKFYNACINRLAGLGLRDNNLTETGMYIDHALEKGIQTCQLQKTRLVWARKTGADSLFITLYNNIISDDPLNHFARFENYLHNPSDSLADNLLRYIDNEFPFQTFLELACWYINYELYQEAVKLLELAPENPLVSLYLAYLYKNLGQKELSEEYLGKLILADTDFVFPYRAETEKMLRWVMEGTDNWKPGYYLALIYWNSGDRERAANLFVQPANEPDDWRFYITRGNFILPEDDLAAERDYREAYKLAPDEWRTNHKMISFYLSGGYNSRALEISTLAYERFRGNYVIDFDHARSLLARDSVYRCIDVLKETIILPHEGSRQGREVWKKANVLASIDSYWYGRIDDALYYIENAYRWPENLGVGKPYKVDERLLDFVKAMVLTKQGEIDRARALYDQIIAECSSEYECLDSYNILKVFALRELNRERESENYFNEWLEQLEDDRIRQWAASLHEGRYGEAGKYALMKPVIPDSDPWEESVDISDLSLLHRVVEKHLQEKW
ncbi:MAG: DUF5107 domain-containing protein [Bacteroidales bacterium]|nr:DUF5107 domain-containing protein [Bacteroidales bacterium]